MCPNCDVGKVYNEHGLLNQTQEVKMLPPSKKQCPDIFIERFTDSVGFE